MDAQAGTRRPPPADAIASFVRFSRTWAGWKQEALAFKAGVSLSTIQRVERGEPVSAECLDRIGDALNQAPGVLTRPRARLSEREAVELMIEKWGWMADMMPVAVAPLRTQRQLRALSDTTLALVDDNLGPNAADEIAGFREWLGLLSFVRAEQIGMLGGVSPRTLELRRLYRDVLDASHSIERAHGAVCLAGVYTPKNKLKHFQGAQLALVAFRSSRADPAAIKRRTMLAPKSIDLADALTQAFEADD